MVGVFFCIGLLLHVQLGRIRISLFGQPERIRCKHARPTTPKSLGRETNLFPCEVPCHFTIGISRFRRRPCSCWPSGLTSGSFRWGGVTLWTFFTFLYFFSVGFWSVADNRTNSFSRTRRSFVMIGSTIGFSSAVPAFCSSYEAAALSSFAGSRSRSSRSEATGSLTATASSSWSLVSGTVSTSMTGSWFSACRSSSLFCCLLFNARALAAFLKVLITLDLTVLGYLFFFYRFLTFLINLKIQNRKKVMISLCEFAKTITIILTS